MNVLFVDPPSLEGLAGEKSGERKLPTPNMGIIYIASYLESKTDANISILDMATCNLTCNDVPDIVRQFQPSLVGISCKTFNILSAYTVAKLIKAVNAETIVLLGGAHPTALPEQTLSECHSVDAVVVREGENTTLEVYARIKQDKNSPQDIFAGIPGLVWQKVDGEVVHNEERKLIADLDSLPFPDLSLVEYKKYRRVYNPKSYRFQHIYPVFASRGCPFNCTFCMPLHTRKHRVRSIENILNEIDLLNKKHGAQRIYFEDSLFCSREEWFETFCEEYRRRDLHKKVRWGFETRIDTANAEIFKLAKAAGCIYTFFGVESGNAEVLRKANKAYTRDEILEKIGAAKSAEINQVNMSIILGLPFETKKTLQDTLSLIKEAPCDNAGINVLDAYPGTAVFEMADRGEGGLKWVEGKRMNWSAYSREEPMLTINDVTAEDLVSARKKALRILAEKKRKSSIALNLKRIAYFIEFARKDRGKLWKNVVDTVKGEK